MDDMDDDIQRPPPSDEQLIAWYTEPLTAAELSAREGLKHKWLLRQWERLRRGGLIERGGRYLASGNRAAMAAPPAREIDGRPTVGDWRLEDEDPLLTRLFEVHQEPRADLVDVSGGRDGARRRRRRDAT